MKPITDPAKVSLYVGLADEMLLSKGSYMRDFDPAWLAKRGWQVVPVKTERSHLSDEEIGRVIPALNKLGHLECLAVATEELHPRPACYQIDSPRKGIS